MFDAIRKRFALRQYCGRLPRLLKQRYGSARSFTPAQVITTIRKYRMNEKHAQYACALFCSEKAYSDFVAKSRLKPVPPPTDVWGPQSDFIVASLWADYVDARSHLTETFPHLGEHAYCSAGSENSFWCDSHPDFGGHGHGYGHDGAHGDGSHDSHGGHEDGHGSGGDGGHGDH